VSLPLLLCFAVQWLYIRADTVSKNRVTLQFFLLFPQPFCRHSAAWSEKAGAPGLRLLAPRAAQPSADSLDLHKPRGPHSQRSLTGTLRQQHEIASQPSILIPHPNHASLQGNLLGGGAGSLCRPASPAAKSSHGWTGLSESTELDTS
jgi:hypothetical protein